MASVYWLARLYASIHDHDVVFGPVQARYEADVQGSLREDDFHSKIPAQRRPGVCETSQTANVLMHRSIVDQRRFDPALGRSGGEDTLFFALLQRDGARLHFDPLAVVQEPVDQARSSLTWLARRAYCSGQAHARMLRATQRGGLRAAPIAALKLYCMVVAVLGVWSEVIWRRHALRAFLHLGVVTRVLGARDVALYGRMAAFRNDGKAQPQVETSSARE